VNAALAVCRHAIDAGPVDHLLQGRPVAPALREQAHPGDSDRPTIMIRR
jgi:hypothetical protein